MKPTFHDHAGRREWLAMWRYTYGAMTQDVQRKRRALQRLQRTEGCTPATRRAQKMLHYARRVAAKMMGLRQDADERWQRIREMHASLAEQNSQFPLDLGDCRRIDFSFNKVSILFPFMPNWLMRVKGRSYYCRDVQSSVGFSTRNRPEGNTRGMLRFERGHIVIDTEGVAHISPISA